MRLLQPTSLKGTYLFNEHGAVATGEVKPYRAALAERNVHYAAGEEFEEALFEVQNRDGRFLGGDLKLSLQDIRPFYLDEHEVSWARTVSRRRGRVSESGALGAHGGQPFAGTCGVPDRPLLPRWSVADL